MLPSSINRVTISGELTREPKLVTLYSGAPACNIRVAVRGRTTDDAGNWHSRSVAYVDVAALGDLAGFCAERLKVGSEIVVDGHLHWRETNQNGRMREYLNITAHTIDILETNHLDAETSAVE
jgi:single-strand DNA-binding protein